MKYLALDIGEKRIGVAVSDEEGIIARPLLTLSVSPSLMTKLGEIIDKEKPAKIILGLPRHQNGEVSEVAKDIRKFATGIKHEYNVEVDFEDESGTSVEAGRRLREKGLNPFEIKEKVDSEAATIILESYLAGKNN